MIDIRGVNVSIRGKALLSDISLDCGAGEITALCGPNGAGKSTLLAVVADDLAADSGEVRLIGKPVRDYSVRDLAQVRAVFPQGAPIRFGYRVREVISMGRAFRDLPPHMPTASSCLKPAASIVSRFLC